MSLLASGLYSNTVTHPARRELPVEGTSDCTDTVTPNLYVNFETIQYSNK